MRLSPHTNEQSANKKAVVMFAQNKNSQKLDYISTGHNILTRKECMLVIVIYGDII